MVRSWGYFSRFPLGAGGSHPKVDPNFNVLCSIVWRSTAAKQNEVEMTFIMHFVGRGILKVNCVTDRGYLAG